MKKHPHQKQQEQSLLNADYGNGFSTAGDQSTTINLPKPNAGHDDDTDVVTIQQTRQLVWKLPKIGEHDKTRCMIGMQAPPMPNREKQILLCIAALLWITLMIVAAATNIIILFFVSVLVPLVILGAVCGCGFSEYITDGVCTTRRHVNYILLPSYYEKYHFDALYGIIDIRSKLFYVYEIGVDKTIKNVKERYLNKNRIYHKRIALKLNNVIGIECVGTEYTRTKGLYSSTSEHFKLILKYKADIARDYVNANVNVNNNVRQKILNRYSVTKTQANIFGRWFRREYAIYGPKLQIVSLDDLATLRYFCISHSTTTTLILYRIN